MKAVRIASIGLAALAMLAPSAKAEQHPITVTLTQTVKPTPRTYPGVQADILGIRIGMTVSQAEAIAAKTYPGKPVETKNSLSVNHGGISAQSQDFISKVVFQKGTGFQNGAGDILTLYFSNPTTGNVVYGIDRGAIFRDAPKQPLIATVISDLIKKYGPASNPYEHWWQFGEHFLKPCNVGQCGRPGKDVVMGIYAQLNPSAGDRTKVMFLTIRMNDYQLRSESTAAGNSQLIAAVEAAQKSPAKQVVPVQALTGTYVPIADTTPAVLELKKDADNILDITGMITGHALVVGCSGGTAFGINAVGDSSADLDAKTFLDLPKEIFSKYGVGLVTYDGKSYTMSITSFGNPPHTTNANVELSPLNEPIPGKGRILWNRWVGGSIAITVAGRSSAFTFDHAVLKLETYGTGVELSMPPNATVTINGKAYCNGTLDVPLPRNLIDKTPDGSIDFVSGTIVNIQTRKGKQQAIYKINGRQLLITDDDRSISFTIDADGCLDGPNHLKLCKNNR